MNVLYPLLTFVFVFIFVLILGTCPPLPPSLTLPLATTHRSHLAMDLLSSLIVLVLVLFFLLLFPLRLLAAVHRSSQAVDLLFSLLVLVIFSLLVLALVLVLVLLFILLLLFPRRCPRPAALVQSSTHILPCHTQTPP